MKEMVEKYKSNKKRKKQVRVVTFALILLLLVGAIWDVLFLIPALLVIVLEQLYEKQVKKEKENILKEYRQKINDLPIKRGKVLRAMIDEFGNAQIELEDESVIQRNVEIIKSRIKEPLLEEREIPLLLQREEELEGIFPKPILFIPHRVSESITYAEGKNKINSNSKEKIG